MKSVHRVLFNELYKLQGDKAMLELEIRELKSRIEMLQGYLRDAGYRPSFDCTGEFWVPPSGGKNENQD